MGIKSAAKKVGKAIIFMKLFEDIKDNKEPIEADIAKLKEIIEEWKVEAPEDKTAILASILVKAQEGNVEDAKADFVLYNTCTVRENANLKVYGRLGHLKKLKEKNPSMMIALCGCMMQEPSVIEKIKTSYRFVNFIFGTHNIFKFAELLTTMYTSERMIIDIWKDTDQIVEDLPSERKFAFIEK